MTTYLMSEEPPRQLLPGRSGLIRRAYHGLHCGLVNCLIFRKRIIGGDDWRQRFQPGAALDRGESRADGPSGSDVCGEPLPSLQSAEKML